MKIDDRVSGYMAILNSSPPKPAAQNTRSTEKQSAVATSAFSVQLSKAATQQSEDSARLEKLGTIRRQLAEGTYNISGRDVADKILKVIKG